MNTHIPILVGDGGGARGIWQMRFYREIVENLKTPIHKLFKRGFVGGVSAGGINAGGLVHPKGISPEDMINFYIEENPKIFHRSALEPPPLFEPKYENNYLAETLRAHYGETLLTEALCPVFIPAWDLALQEPRYFTEKDYTPIWMACRATAAVPTYLSTWGNWVDGGVYGSNPTLWALAHARKLYGRDAKFLIISVGTGWSKDTLNSVALHAAGELKWLTPIIKTLADANPIVTEMETPWLIGPEDIYFRWQAPVPVPGPSPNLDDGSRENAFAQIQFATDVIEARQAEFISICDALAAVQ